MRTLLTPIEPFNLFFYKSCFYHSLLPAVRCLGKPILPIFLNDVPVFQARGEGMEVEYRSVRPLEDVLGEMGIVQHEGAGEGDVLDEVIASLEQKQPVILWVDCFHLSGRKDAWQREHWPHTLLVFGYDPAQQRFDVLEHLHRDSMTYEPRTIDGEELARAHAGYREQFQDRTHPAFLKYQAANVPSQHTERCSEKVRALHHEMREGVQQLSAYFASLLATARDESKLRLQVSERIADLNSILNGKLAERYKQEQVQADEQLLLLLNDLIGGWTNVRAVFVKFMYSGVYRAASFDSLAAVFETLQQKETEYCERVTGGVLHG